MIKKYGIIERNIDFHLGIYYTGKKDNKWNTNEKNMKLFDTKEDAEKELEIHCYEGIYEIKEFYVKK